MNERASSFLAGVLGDDGARAFKKAMEREQSLAAAVVPRAIVSWLNLATNFSYSGNIPGLENTFVEFKKSDRGYDGAISIGHEIYSFKNATPYHLAASVAVALGIDETGVTDQTRDATLQRLGKSIDTLVKSRMSVPESQTLLKAISAIPPGPEVREVRQRRDAFGHEPAATTRVHNYDHVLSPEHKQAGYQMHVQHDPKSGRITAKLTHRDPVQGLTQRGYLVADHEGQNLEVFDADLHQDHWGKGLGSALYESVMAHGFHSGARQVVGSIHSTLASKAHQRLSSKHDMNYQPTPTPSPQLISPGGPGANDARHGPYQYAMKTEMPGSANKPTAQQEALKPQAPQFQTAQPDPRRMKTARISKAESGVKCGMCRRTQFSDTGFVGCMCFRDLAKSVSILKADASGYTLGFTDDWDADAILALRRTMRE